MSSPTSTFKDHFSGHSASYANFRPDYPDALFARLAACCSRHDLAWDCATGSGQAAASLAQYFDKVIATDASAGQIDAALPADNIEFRVAPAEKSELAGESVDLITVAQALHWFDINKFFDEATRVLRPGGVLAVWCYENCRVDPDCDEVIRKIFAEVESYWPAERDIVVNHYDDITLPLPELPVDRFSMTANWTVEQILGYMRTWSASQRYIKDKGTDPTQQLGVELARRWGDRQRRVAWPLTLRIGRA